MVRAPLVSELPHKPGMMEPELNLPIFEELASCKNLLIAGMGGGFDLFCGLPIAFELQRRGQAVHLANLSFAEVTALTEGIHLSPTLVGIRADQPDLLLYFPERYLARWFAEKRGTDVTVWCFHKTGARPLLDNYRRLVDHLAVDGILLIDGGVDGLMRGDETHAGTLIEDATSLYAVNELTHLPVRILACLGLGAEQDVAYTQVLENIATLTQAGGFLGTCALTPGMPVYQAYEEAVLYTQSHPYQEASVINSCIISAARGQFGNYHLTEKTQGSRLWISPLMSLYWFFALPVVARHNRFLPHLRETDTFMDAVFAQISAMKGVPRRSTPSLPL